MNDIQVDRYDRLFRKLFDIRAGVIAPTMAPEIVPTYALEPDDRAEMEYLRDNRLWMGYGNGAVVALQYGQVSLHNNSADRLVIVERVDGIGLSIINVGGPIVGGLGAIPQARDTRYEAQPSAANIVVGSTLVALAPCWFATATPFIYERIRVVLTPGEALNVQAQAVQNAITIQFAWRERTFEAAEV